MKCRVCGCTDDHACAGGCAWFVEGLCTACIAHATRAELNLAHQRRSVLADDELDIVLEDALAREAW